MPKVGFPGQGSNSCQEVIHKVLPKLGFDVGGVLSSLGTNVTDMQLSADVVKLLSHVKLLAGAENMVLISKVDVQRRCEIKNFISRTPLLSSCFPPDRCFFGTCDKEDAALWKLSVVRDQKVDIMVDDSYNVCKAIRTAGFRCIRPVKSGRGRDVMHHDNFLSPEEAVRAVVRELIKCRQRLRMPTAPFNVFGANVPPSISQHRSVAVVLPVAENKQDEPAAFLEPEKPEDSLAGWRRLPEPVPAETTERSQSSCLGRHLHQPAVCRRKRMSFRQWQIECLEQAKIARCQSCVRKWREVFAIDDDMTNSWQ